MYQACYSLRDYGVCGVVVKVRMKHKITIKHNTKIKHNIAGVNARKIFPSESQRK